MAFWKMAYDNKWITAQQVSLAVITEQNPYGELTKEQYTQITGFVFPATK